MRARNLAERSSVTARGRERRARSLARASGGFSLVLIGQHAPFLVLQSMGGGVPATNDSYCCTNRLFTLGLAQRDRAVAALGARIALVAPKVLQRCQSL